MVNMMRGAIEQNVVLEEIFPQTTHQNWKRYNHRTTECTGREKIPG